MSTEQPQPEFQRTFTAAEFMHELARVSGADVSVFAPELAEDMDDYRVSAIESSLELHQYQMQERENQESLAEALSFLRDSSKQILEAVGVDAFDEAVALINNPDLDESYIEVDQGLLDDLLHHPADIMVAVSAIPEADRAKAIGLWLSILVSAIPLEPNGPPEPTTYLDMRPALGAAETLPLVDNLGQFLDHGRDLMIYGDVGNDCGFGLGWTQPATIRVKGNVGKGAGTMMTSESGLTIEGTVGDELGYSMSNGIITVIGDAGESVGKAMQAGTIEVHGNVGYLLGERMQNGEIRVSGNAGKEVAARAMNGTIKIMGTAESFNPQSGADIYVGPNQEQVVSRS